MLTSSIRVLKSLALILFVASHVSAAGTYHEVTFAPSENPNQLQIGVTHTLWIPADTKTIRGIIVHQHGCGVGACQGGTTAAYDLHWQALARKWDCALLGPSYHQAEDQNCRLWCDPRNGSSAVFVQALRELAEKSSRPEIAHVPWCLWGHSGGGYWASLLQMEFPERIVAIWFQSGTAHGRWVSGEVATPEIPAAAMKIPMMATPGLKERDHERFQSAWTSSLGMFRDYRSRGAPIAFTPDPKSGHETRDSRYLAIPFFDACCEQRLPATPGSAGPLREMDPARAWLAPLPLDPTDQQPQPTKAADFQGNPTEAVWLPNKRVALAWSEFIWTGAVSDSTPPPSPTDVQAEELNDGMAVTWQATADLESGVSGFRIRRDGQLVGRVPAEATTRFGRPLFQQMSYHDTPESPLPEMRFFDEDGAPSNSYSVQTVNGVGLLSSAVPLSAYRDLTFAEVNSRKLKLDLYLPKIEEPPPLVVWIHGGGWRGGSKDKPPFREITKHGYALASISYRFTDEAIFPAQIHDCKAAIRWLRSHAGQFGYNADWIAVAGSSAGGHLALLLGVSGEVDELEGKVGSHLDQSSAVQAVIDFFGPSDFVLRGQTQPERAYTEKSGSFALLGGVRAGTVTTEMEQLASPAHYVSAEDPPLLIFHGRADKVVLLDQSQRMAERYSSSGLQARLIILEDAGHGGKQFFSDQYFEAAREFLDQHRPD